MSSATEYHANDAKRVRECSLTTVVWEDGLHASNKKSRRHVLDFAVLQEIHLETNRLERDIVKLEFCIWSIRDKIHA